MRRKPLFPPPISVASGKKKHSKGRPAYSVLTINGRIRLRRTRWHCPEEGSDAPLDRVVDEAQQTISRGARELACRLNQDACSFQKAAENVGRAAQLSLSKEQLRQVVEAEGRTVQKAQAAGELRPTWKAEDCVVEQSTTTRMYVGLDGVQVPVITEEEKQKRRQKIREKRRRRGRKCRPLPRAKRGADCSYKEFRVAAFYDEMNEHCHVAAIQGDHTAAGRLLAREATRLGLHRVAEKIANVDGAPWIRNELELHGVVDEIGLDFYHLSEHVEKARLAVFGEEAEAGKQWAEGMMHCFKHEGYQAACKRLRDWKDSHGSGAKERKQAAKVLMGYITPRREMIRYPEFLARGWQIGSGPTEAQCRTTTKRLKGSSRRWDVGNAQAVMTLACLENSNTWDEYWFTPAPSSN
jgi:hypothetical protein